MLRAAGLALIAVLAATSVCAAQGNRLRAKDSENLQDCIKTAAPGATAMDKAEKCIGVISEPCLKEDKADTTVAMENCIARERVVWDDILNETYRRLGKKLDAGQSGKLRDMQRAWIASRDATCGFYRDYYGGTIATPMASECVNRETARRALFLLGFLLADDK